MAENHQLRAELTPRSRGPRLQFGRAAKGVQRTDVEFRHREVVPLRRIRHTQLDMRARVRWIQRHRALEQRHRAIEHFERLALSIEQSAREGLVRADDLRLGQRACGRNRRAQRAGELAHQSILHFKNCGERAIDLRRPRHLSRRHIGQRCRHAKRVTRPLKAAAHEPARLEVTRGAEEQPVVSIPCLQTKPLQDLQHALARNHGDAFQLSRRPPSHRRHFRRC